MPLRLPTKTHERLSEQDAALLDALRRGDEDAFMMLVERYHPAMLRLARTFVPTQAVAEEVVQEAWLGALQGLARFEGRSSLRTWLFAIVANKAKTRGERERRSVPFSSVQSADGSEAAVDPPSFRDGAWIAPPAAWPTPHDRAESREMLSVIREAVALLSEMQRRVLVLRDVEGVGSEEVCRLLEISEGNQRVLLHRARARVRRALEVYHDA